MSIDFQQATLPNGLTVIGEVIPAAHSAAMGFYVKAGARDEQPSLMGVSHFLEHMMFKGTEARSAEDVDRQFDELGATHNAYTTSELTCFWVHTLPEHLGAAEEILSDLMRPALRPDDFSDEKQVIIEEIAMYRDQPFWVLYEQSMERYYKAHPLSHRVLGTDETITGLKRDEMLEYFTHRYSADNTVVTLAGRIDFDAMVQRIEAHCGSWPASGALRSHPDHRFEPDDFTIRSATVHRNYLLSMSPAPGLGDDRRYAAGMLSQILGESEGSRLYWALVETGLAEDAEAHYDGRDGLGELLVYCSCPPEDADEVEAVLQREIDGLVDSLTPDDLERVRAKAATAVTLHGELPAGRMRRLGHVWTYSGAYRSLESELERINAVTLDDLRQVAVDFPLNPRVTARLLPEEG